MEYGIKKVIVLCTMVLLITATVITLSTEKDAYTRLICFLCCVVAIKLGKGLVSVYKTKENEEL